MTSTKLIARYVYLLILAAVLTFASDQTTGSLKGVVTDPSGALVPNATVVVKGDGGGFKAKTDGTGRYSIGGIPVGKYLVGIGAKGFAVTRKPDFEIKGPTTLSVELVISTDAQIVNVEDDNGAAVTTDPTSNGTALILGQKELAALSDDPDELSDELQAMAGPGGGPNGGQIYVDGFTGGNMPAKSSIREVRINSNPYSTEYDKPGFGRIEIFTKPGSDTFRGQAFFQYNNQDFNSRSPLLTSSTRAPYGNRIEGLSLSGPVKKNKASFSFDFERRDITENAFVDATTLDSSLNPLAVNQSIVTPQTRMTFTPRLDYTINSKNTLVVRYQHTGIELDKSGVGGFNLASQAYNETQGENTVQATETAVISPTMINESRFQFMRSTTGNVANNTAPTINVAGAFADGGVSIGNSNNVTSKVEFTNTTSITHGTHSFKWGGRLRESLDTDTSLNGFNGTFTFLGGTGPELDSNDQAIAGTLVDLSALQVYQRTLLGEQEGLTAAQIRLLGGGASQFTLSAGKAATTVDQFDAGLFINDDWRVKPNLTLSYGLRYETQNNIHDLTDFAPRFGMAWGLGGHANQAAKTVLRLGAGIFYDRIADTVTLDSERYNGSTQQSYFIQNPTFFPNIPATSLLLSSLQPQRYEPFYSGLKVPATYQASIGLERQVTKFLKLTGQYVEGRGVHLANSRNINTPIDGVYPFGDTSIRLLTESSGESRTHQLFISPNINYKKIFLFGFYVYSHGRDDNEGQPADPYNVRAEWGPSTFADVRHRFVMGTMVPLPWKFSVGPFIVASSGTPYDITTGQDTALTGYATERPSLNATLNATQCTGTDLVYNSNFGCFSLNPTPGTEIGRNSARGPANVTVNMRLSRTWSFGARGESGAKDNGGPPPGMGGIRGGGGPPPGGGGGPPGGGPPPGMFGAASGKKYNLTMTISARNLLNHSNYAAPNGDLSSPFFGQSTSLAGFGPMGNASTFNRKIDLQLRFQF